MGEKLVIFVDDEVDMHIVVRAGLKKICRERSLILECFENGKQCINYVDENINNIEIILIISDLSMPIMDGYELLKQIKSKHQHIKVVISSAYDDDETTDKVKKLGASSFFSKPINFKTLIEKIEHIMDDAIATQE